MKSAQITNIFARILFFILVITFVGFIIFGIKELMVSVIIAFFLSLALNPIVYFFESIGFSRLISVVFSISLFLVIIYLLIYFLVPIIVDEFNKIYELMKFVLENLPGFIKKMESLIQNYFMLENFTITIKPETIINSVIKPIFSFDVFSFLPNFITFLIVSPILLFIFMLEGDAIYRQMMAIIPNRFFEMTILITNNIKNSIISYLKGIMIQIMILAAILCTGLWIIKLPYGILLGIFAALVNIIPYVGPILGFIPILLVSLIAESELSLLSILIFGFAQLIDNIYTQPVILSRSVNIHPIIAIFSVIAFQKLFGIVGMAIALPIAGIIVMTIQIMYKTLKAYDIL